MRPREGGAGARFGTALESGVSGALSGEGEWWGAAARASGNSPVFDAGKAICGYLSEHGRREVCFEGASKIGCLGRWD